MYGLYVHIPFCIQKCKYCDFISFDNCPHRQDAYVDALIRQMQEYRGAQIDTVFIGGGTPTVLKSENLERLLVALQNCFDILPDAEFTVEANPKTVTKEKLDILLAHGVNRISLGIQSFCDEELAGLGRVHTAAEAVETVALLKQYPFDLNFDFMFAIPKQTKESLQKSLERAISLQPEHISCYSLILEEGTPLADLYDKGLISLPEEEEERECYHMAREILEQAGYAQYEISNFAKRNKQCRHNLKYWNCEEYIGIGLAAHSYYQGERFFCGGELDKYLAGGNWIESRELLSREDKIEEFMIMGFRLIKGVSETEFQKRFGVSVTSVYQAQLNRFLASGLMQYRDGYYRLTADGISVSNSVLCEFLLTDMKKSD